jgi:hypothetical protein
MKDGADWQGLALRAVNDQIRIDNEKSCRFVRLVIATVPTTRMASQKIDLLADDGFNSVRDLNVGFLKVNCSFRRQNLADAHSTSNCFFRLARYASSLSSGNPSPRSSWPIPRRIFALITARFSRSQRSCSSCVSRSRISVSSTLPEPVARIYLWILASRIGS